MLDGGTAAGLVAVAGAVGTVGLGPVVGEFVFGVGAATAVVAMNTAQRTPIVAARRMRTLFWFRVVEGQVSRGLCACIGPLAFCFVSGSFTDAPSPE